MPKKTIPTEQLEVRSKPGAGIICDSHDEEQSFYWSSLVAGFDPPASSVGLVSSLADASLSQESDTSTRISLRRNMGSVQGGL